MKPDINTLIKNYLKELRIQNKTIVDAKYALKKYTAYLANHSGDLFYLSIHDAQEFHNYLATRRQSNGTLSSSSTVGVIISYVNSFYAFLKRHRLVSANPFKEIKRIKHEKKLPRNISKEEEMQSLLVYLRAFNTGNTTREKARRYKAHVAAELMYACGARISEIVTLKEEDINFERGTIVLHESKTGQVRECIINEYARDIVKVYVEKMRDELTKNSHHRSRDYVFGATDSLKRLVNSLLKEACCELGISQKTSHVFRHGVGCHFLKRGCDIRYIQQVLGHRALSSTQVYTHVDKKDLLEIIDTCHPRGKK